jgi:hypothetical protein
VDGSSTTPIAHPIPVARQMLGGLGVTKIYELLKAGDLDGFTIGRSRFITDESIRRLVAKRLAAERKSAA